MEHSGWDIYNYNNYNITSVYCVPWWCYPAGCTSFVLPFYQVIHLTLLRSGLQYSSQLYIWCSYQILSVFYDNTSISDSKLSITCTWSNLLYLSLITFSLILWILVVLWMASFEQFLVQLVSCNYGSSFHHHQNNLGTFSSTN